MTAFKRVRLEDCTCEISSASPIPVLRRKFVALCFALPDRRLAPHRQQPNALLQGLPRFEAGRLQHRDRTGMLRIAHGLVANRIDTRLSGDPGEVLRSAVVARI